MFDLQRQIARIIYPCHANEAWKPFIPIILCGEQSKVPIRHCLSRDLIYKYGGVPAGAAARSPTKQFIAISFDDERHCAVCVIHARYEMRSNSNIGAANQHGRHCPYLYDWFNHLQSVLLNNYPSFNGILAKPHCAFKNNKFYSL